MDVREDAAQYYDFQDNPTDDIAFYRARLPSPQARVLELGCGTGRVLLPLLPHCGFIHGVDASAAMLAICRAKLDQANVPPARAQVTLADITDYDLGQRFDLITAPFRVFQNLETDAQVGGLFRCIHRHLAHGGSALLNTFNPYRPADKIRRAWCDPGERLDVEIALPDGKRLVRYDRRPRLNPDPLILYPELVYRVYSVAGEMEKEAVLKIAMRCWYKDELEEVITRHGFQITGHWGGYTGETWGEGSELVVEFRAS